MPNRQTDIILVVLGQSMLTSSECHLISSLNQVVGGELEPEEKEELAEKIGKLLQRDRMGVRTKLGNFWAEAM